MEIKNKLYLLLLLISCFSCSKEETQSCAEDCGTAASSSEKMIIESYLTQNNLIAQQTCQGVYYIIDQSGNSTMPDRCSSVTVHYEGKLLNGEVFDSSYDRGEASTFSLSGVIEGWKSGIPQFGEGGMGTLIIPPSLGYGTSGTSGIPGNSTLIFEIDLKSVN